MLYAARLEERIAAIENGDLPTGSGLNAHLEELIGDREYVSKDDLHDYVNESDLQSEIDKSLGDLDLSEYAVKDEIDELVAESLGNSDLVKDVAVGAVRGIAETLRERSVQPMFQRHTLIKRLRWLVTGSFEPDES
jgi:hypothetical protein